MLEFVELWMTMHKDIQSEQKKYDNKLRIKLRLHE